MAHVLILRAEEFLEMQHSNFVGGSPPPSHLMNASKEGLRSISKGTTDGLAIEGREIRLGLTDAFGKVCAWGWLFWASDAADVLEAVIELLLVLHHYAEQTSDPTL